MYDVEKGQAKIEAKLIAAVNLPSGEGNTPCSEIRTRFIYLCLAGPQHRPVVKKRSSRKFPKDITTSRHMTVYLFIHPFNFRPNAPEGHYEKSCYVVHRISLLHPVSPSSRRIASFIVINFRFSDFSKLRKSHTVFSSHFRFCLY